MKFLLLLTCIFYTSLTLAQGNEKVLTRVKYAFTHIQDTTKKDQPYTENMVLLASKNASLYISYDKVNQIIEGRKQQAQAGSGPITFVFNNPIELPEKK